MQQGGAAGAAAAAASAEDRFRGNRNRHRNYNNNAGPGAAGGNGDNEPRISTSPIQRAFWQAITVGELETMQVLLEHREIDVNKFDESGEQRQGCSALHLAILEMPTWKTEGRTEGRNGIQTAEFVKKFFTVLLDHGADIERPCKYTGEWYLQTAAGKTKSFFPDGYDALGLVLQFVEITRGAEVISTNVTRRLELIRDLLLDHIKTQAEPAPLKECSTLLDDMSRAFQLGNFADVDLVVDGEIISAHRVVLAARSAVFAAMFGPDTFRESKTRRVEITQVDPVALRVFVQFLYEDSLATHPVDSDFQLCHHLIMLANRYDVRPLKIKCSDIVLKYHLAVDNAATILRIADQNQVDDLREQTLAFISNQRNVDDVMATNDFKSLDSDLVREVLRTVVSARPSPSAMRRTSNSRSPQSTKRMRTTVVEVSDDDAVRAPPNNADEANEDEEAEA